MRSFLAWSRLRLVAIMPAALPSPGEGMAMLDKILPRNLSVADRIIRILLGLAILSLVVIGPQTAWGYLGLVLVATGLIGRCALYGLFGISTLRDPVTT